MKPSISNGPARPDPLALSPVPNSRCRCSSARKTVSKKLTLGRPGVSIVDVASTDTVAGVSAAGTNGGPEVPGLSLSETVAVLLRRRGMALPKKNWS